MSYRPLTVRRYAASRHGASALREELRSLTILHQLLLRVARVCPFRFSSITVYTNPLCIKRCLSVSRAPWKSHLANQESEINWLRKQLGKLSDNLVTLVCTPAIVDPIDLRLRQIIRTNMTLETGTQRITELGDSEDQRAQAQMGGQEIA